MAEEYSNFFARSNVTKITLTKLSSCARAFDILQYATNVQQLVLDEVWWTGREEDDFPADPDVKLNTLYLLQSTIDFDELEAVVSRLNVQKLIFWGDCCTKPYYEDFALDAPSQGEQDKLMALCPMVEFIPHGHPKPMGSQY